MFANLLDNAIKYTPPGGHVAAAVSREGDEAIVRIEDTGVGIAPADLPRIWERLYRADRSRSERGLGLGLSLVKAYVEAHGGRIEATSELGHGSVFVVRLPAGNLTDRGPRTEDPTVQLPPAPSDLVHSTLESFHRCNPPVTAQQGCLSSYLVR